MRKIKQEHLKYLIWIKHEFGHKCSQCSTDTIIVKGRINFDDLMMFRTGNTDSQDIWYLYIYMQVQWRSIKIVDGQDLARRPPFEEPCSKSFDQLILELTCQQF